MSRDYYGMTVDPTKGTTYWQMGRYATISELVKHVKRYSQGMKHLVIYRMDSEGCLQFVDHMNKETY